MAVKKQELKVLSCDGVHKLAGVVFLPAREPVGFFQVVHGMTEYIGRYERFMIEMAERGWICFGHDHLGHGHSVNDASELGFIAHENGADLLQRDVKKVADAIIKHYTTAGKKLPYVLMGHSMGSFIVRLAVEKKYVQPDRLIVMGTGGPNPVAGIGLLLIKIIKRLRGERHISKLLENVAFGSYNDAWGGGTEIDTDPWLTSDVSVRMRYYADPLCTFKFTASAMGDLVTLTKEANRKEWFTNMPKNIPVLLVAGQDDPVGDFSEGVEKVHEKLLKAGVKSEIKIYENARHEILNDISYNDVVRDILIFCR